MIKNFIKPDTIEQACELVKEQLVKDQKDKVGYFGNGVFLNNPTYPVKYETVISLQNLALNDIKEWTVNGQKGLKIGSMLTFQTIIDGPPNIPDILKQAAKHEYSRPIRNMKTLGGDINVSTHSSHFSPTLVALSAMVELKGEEWMPFEAYKNTSQRELITNIFLPDSNIKCNVKRLSLNTHMPTIVSVAAALDNQDKNIIVAIGGIADGIEKKIIHLSDLEEQTDKISYIEKAVTKDLIPDHDSELHGSNEYIKYVTGVVVADCIKSL